MGNSGPSSEPRRMVAVKHVAFCICLISVPSELQGLEVGGCELLPPDFGCMETWLPFMGNSTNATDTPQEKGKAAKGKDKLYDAMIPAVGAAASSSWIPSLASAAAGVAAAIAVTAALIVLWRQAPASDASERLNENIHDAEPGPAVE